MQLRSCEILSSVSPFWWSQRTSGKRRWTGGVGIRRRELFRGSSGSCIPWAANTLMRYLSDGKSSVPWTSVSSWTDSAAPSLRRLLARHQLFLVWESDISIGRFFEMKILKVHFGRPPRCSDVLAARSGSHTSFNACFDWNEIALLESFLVFR